MIGRTWAIAINTFREAVRDKVLYGVLAFATLVLLFTLALAELSLGEERRVVMDIGLASISIFSVIVAVFLGSSLLYKEIERKTLHVILPRPVRRWEFLVGKYLGIALTGFVFICIMGATQLWVASIQADAPLPYVVAMPVVLAVLLVATILRSRDRTTVLLPLSVLALGSGVALASMTDVDLTVAVASLVLTAGEVLVVAAVAVLFSSFSTPFLTGAFTLGVWLAGRSADSMVNMRTEVFGAQVKGTLRVLAEIVPNLNLFVPGRHTLQTMATELGGVGPWTYVAQTMGYGILYSGVVLVVASIIFSRRDFL